MSRGPPLMLVLTCALAGILVGCDDMSDQPKYETYEDAPGFPQAQAARQPPAGTVARGALERERAKRHPPEVTQALLSRGQERYEIFCAPCHGLAGDADGMIVQRGFPAPPSYHTARLRSVSDRHIFNVISDGYGVMFPYGNRIAVRDRWSIVAYVRALQRARQMSATATVVPEAKEPGG
ncbi:cytochrome c [Amorphus sp. 3PC139-8]|uniref:c-type cytochrome n=1 Tax=Amorphus sp. 3PC139-8 TaxID=2735676 RepID=UPI00345C7E75